ncbi:MAG: transporter substrate-binding protein [Eubacterium sp.]|nr:transporter substrate-binding protein [Eubacterium sp.]
MSKKLSKILCLLLVFTVIVSFAAACGSSGQSVQSTAGTSESSSQASTNEVKADDNSPITFSMYIPYKWYDHKWDTDIAKTITEKTGVTVDLQVSPVDNGYEKLDMMIASDSLPDLVLVDLANAARTKMEQGNLAVSIEELCEKAGTDELRNNIGDFSMNWFKNADGKTYVVPNFVATPETMKTGKDIESNYVYGVREDMYKAVGSPDTSTVEGFTKMLKDVKAKFPEIDGKSIIPFLFTDPGAGWSDQFDGAIAGGFNANYLPTEEDYLKNYEFPFLKPNYKEAVKFVNGLVREGLSPKEYYTYKTEQVKELATQGRLFCIAGHSSGGIFTQTNDFVKAHPEAKYVPIEYPRNSKGEEPRLTPGNAGTGWNGTLVTKKCKDVARAAKFLTFTSSEEGDTIVNWGVKGVHYTDIGADGLPTFTQEVLDARKNDYAKSFQNKMGFDSLWLFGTSFTKFSKLSTATRDDAQKARYEMSNKYAELDVWFTDNNIKPDATSPEGLLLKKITEDIKARTLPKLFLAKSDADFDKEWNNMAEKINSEPGLKTLYAKVMEIANSNYTKFKAQ